MPVTKTAKRALRSSLKKEQVNELVRKNLQIAMRLAKKEKSKKAVSKVFSLADRAAKIGVLHTNKAARLKSSFSKLVKPAKKSSK